MFTLSSCVPDTLLRTLDDLSPTTDGSFGHSVAISGDLVVVGAPQADPGGAINSGIAFVFGATSGTLVVALSNPAAEAGDHFGESMAISGDLVVVGARDYAPGGVINVGIAYVFNATTGNLVATLNNPNPTADDYFGDSVAISGNLVIVGAFYDDPGGVTDGGTAYVFNATSGALVTTLNSPAPVVDDRFGISVAISGNLAVVGADQVDLGGVINTGNAYVFDATSGSLLATLNNPASAESDHFGFSVAISGNKAVVGAFLDDPGGEGEEVGAEGRGIASGRRAEEGQG